jgi:predicted nucleotidyltransferase
VPATGQVVIGYMKGDKHSAALQQTLASIFRGVREVRLVYLFGSKVYDDEGPLSDYDFGILFDERKLGPSLVAEVGHALSKVLETDRVDVVPLNRAPIELAYSVIFQGELIYEFDRATRVEYEARILGLYGDYLPVLREQRRDILQGGVDDTRVQRYREAFRRTERTLGEIAAAQKKI